VEKKAATTGRAGTEGGVAAAAGQPSRGGAKGASDLARTQAKLEADLDEFLAAAHEADPSEFTDEDGWRYFTLGDTEARICVGQVEHDVCVRVESPVITVPAEQDVQIRLLREALEYNAAAPGHSRIGISNNLLVAVAMQPASNIGEGGLAALMEDTVVMAAVASERFMKAHGPKVAQGAKKAAPSK
jgi:hypothetical protein